MMLSMWAALMYMDLGTLPRTVQELSERNWRGDPPARLGALKGTGGASLCIMHNSHFLGALP